MTRFNAGFLIVSATVGLVNLVGCNKPSATSGTAEATPGKDTKPSDVPVSSTTVTAQDVLEKMAAAYKNTSAYEDFGTLEFRTNPAQERSETRASFSVAFQRPNKLRAELFSGRVICDGKQWCAFCDMVPGQAVLREAPPKLGMNVLQADDLLYSALNGGSQVPSPQLQLLWDENPLASLTNGSQDVALDEPGRLGDFDCYRVRVNLPEGSEYLWIDKKTFALRQLVVPLANGARQTDGDKRASPIWLVFNFERARLGGEIDSKAFQFEIADNVKKTRALVQTGPFDLVGQRLPEFKFADLQGKPWSSQSLAGKAAVLFFWKSDVVDTHPMIPTIADLYATYKNNDKVAVFAVNLDPPDTPAKMIEDAGKQLKITAPLLRDNGMEARERLKIIELPTTLFIDSKGVLQYCSTEFSPIAAAAAPRKLEKLLAGEDLAKQTIGEFQQQSKEIERRVDMQFSGEALTTTVEQAKPTAAATKSEPRKLHLKSQWKCTEVHPAGNILVAQDPGGKPRIYVIDGFKAISEIGLDGKRVANFAPKIAKDEFFINLRSAVGRDGKRYSVAFAPTEQRFHLFDEKFNYLLSYPADALENRHAGLSDVELGDLNGDGVLKAYVGFAGTVGVKCVSLQGTVIWPCRSLFNVGSVILGPVNTQGQGQLYCVSDASSVAVLDCKGQLRDAAKLIAEGTLRCLTRADLTGNGETTWCGIMFAPDPQQTSGKFTALGLSPSGEVLWKYAMPAGTQQAVEPIVVGRLLPGTTSQWLLPGSDGSIHVLAADGTLIDRFNYGELVTGLATVEIDGKPVLLISSANGVEALRVE